ncbi:flagellar hook-basal body complex protein FliE [uncultured Paludibaculum sp.]|uniref:flagellar hook-basal body complex protein FliE n=1 Tax=uncultured Paludibaculum sp. TaxID=1765020 RepID=UPI002AAAADE1|nr:flagellar hook-basal body complex protein FliE [uncultured Paludibaculum sp.]
MTIPPISPIQLPRQIGQILNQPGGSGASFQSAMTGAMEAVNSIQHEANASIESFLNGEGQDLHKVALDQQRAGIAFDLFLQVRNKVVTAYQEVMRMQV